MRRLLALLLLAAGLVLWTPGVSYACSCAAIDSTQERVRLADAVFVGTPIDDREVNTRMRYLVEVTDDFGQQLPKRVEVRSESDSAACGLGKVPLEQERIWFTDTEGSRLTTNICMGGQESDEATIAEVAAAIGPSPPSLADKVHGTDQLRLEQPAWQRWANLVYALVLAGGLLVFVFGHRYRARRARDQQPPTV